MPDLRAMRDDPARFAAEVRGRRLESWQEDDMRAVLRYHLLTWLWSRQSGKSLVAAYLVLWLLFRAPQQLVLIASGSGDLGAKRLLRTAREIAAGSDLLRGSVLDETGHVLSTSNGSEARAIATNEAAARGWSADAVVADEAQSLPDDFLLSGLLPTLLARPGSFGLLLGTAGRAEGAYYDLWRQAEIGAEGMQFSRRVSKLVGGAEPMPWQSATMMGQIERALGPLRADAELRCIPATGLDYLFSPAEADAITADYRADELSGLEGPAGVGAGLDLGVKRDRSGLVALSRPAFPTPHPVFAVRCAHVWPQAYPLMAPFGGGAGVFEELAGSPAVLQWLRVDETGMQSGLLQYLWPLMRSRPSLQGGGQRPPRVVMLQEDLGEVFDTLPARMRDIAAAHRGAGPAVTDLGGVVFTSALKQAAYGALRALVERRQLVIPASAVELRQELLALRVGLNRSGETFDAESGGFDDLPDALVLALRPHRRRDGSWVTAVGDLADRPMVDVRRWRELNPGELVSTGGGLQIPAVPAWAPLVGHLPDVTVPTEAAQWPAPEPPEDPRMEALRERVAAAMQRQKEIA